MSTDTTLDARQHLAELEQRVLDGDDTVTAAALQKAKAAADLAALHDEATRRRAGVEAAARRQADQDAFRAEVAEAARQLPGVQSAYASVVDALRALNASTAAWERQRRSFVARAKALGLDGEADDLVDLGRNDWIATAAAEAAGEYRTGTRMIEAGRLTRSAVVFHPLHDRRTRETLEAEQLARLTASAERMRARDEAAAADREARAAMDRRNGEIFDALVAERVDGARVKPPVTVNR